MFLMILLNSADAHSLLEIIKIHRLLVRPINTAELDKNPSFKGVNFLTMTTVNFIDKRKIINGDHKSIEEKKPTIVFHCLHRVNT